MKPYNMEKPVGMPNLIDRLYMSYKNAFIFIISIINNEYKLMLVRTIKDKSFGIPGGMSENAEIPIETACREFKEETGNILTKQELILHNFKKYYYKPYKSVIYYGIIPYKELNSGSIYNDEIDYILTNYGTQYTSKQLLLLNPNINIDKLNYLDYWLINKIQWINFMLNIKLYPFNSYKISSYYSYIDFNLYYSLINDPQKKLNNQPQEKN